MGSLDGRVAWITGGGKGIGRAVALALSARGAHVLVTGRDERALGRVVGEIANAGGKARHLVADVRDAARAKEAVAKAVDTWGSLDIVVANAGQASRAELGTSDDDRERGRAVLETNLIGAYCTFDAALPLMKGPGRLIAMSTAWAPTGEPGYAGYAAYAASKAGLLGLVRSAARELAPRGITVNAVLPPRVDTELTSAMLRDIARATDTTPNEAKAELLKRLPKGRLLDPEEVAEVVVYLCGPEASEVTGRAMEVPRLA